MKILLVEDNFIAAMDIKLSIEERGSEVLGPFGQVSKVSALLANERPDAAILDFNLGKENSVPIAERLLELECPFAFVTGYSDLPDLPNALRGAPLLSKPIKQHELAKLLGEFEAVLVDRGS